MDKKFFVVELYFKPKCNKALVIESANRKTIKISKIVLIHSVNLTFKWYHSELKKVKFRIYNIFWQPFYLLSFKVFALYISAWLQKNSCVEFTILRAMTRCGHDSIHKSKDLKW